jgi:hypothetical protein
LHCSKQVSCPRPQGTLKSSAKTRTCDAEALFKLLNSNDHELKLKVLLKFCDKALLKKLRNLCSNDLEFILTALLRFCNQALLKKLRNPRLRPRRGPRWVLKLTERLGLIETLIRIIEAIDWNEQSAVTTGRGITLTRLVACYEEIPTEKTPFSRQTSVLGSFKSSSGFVFETCIVGRWTRSDDARAEQDEMYSNYIVTFNHIPFLFVTLIDMSFLLKVDSLNPPSSF